MWRPIARLRSAGYPHRWARNRSKRPLPGPRTGQDPAHEDGSCRRRLCRYPRRSIYRCSIRRLPLGDDGKQPTKFIQVPGVAAFMSHNSFSADVKGVADEQQRMVELLNSNEDFVKTYGDAKQYDFRPPQMVTFWTFRLMIGTAAFSAALALWGLWATRKGQTSASKALGIFALVSIPMPFLGASFGWIFTEMGRQPWVVVPNHRRP